MRNRKTCQFKKELKQTQSIDILTGPALLFFRYMELGARIGAVWMWEGTIHFLWKKGPNNKNFRHIYEAQ